MDVLSLIGLLLAFVAIVGATFEGGHISALLNGPAALIVLGGTLGAVLLQTPIAVFMRAMSIGRWIFFPPRIDLARGILMVTTWSNTARKEGLLGLEPVAETEPDPYARKGLQLLVDGAEPEVIRSILEVDLYTQEGRDLRAAESASHRRCVIVAKPPHRGVAWRFANLLVLPVGNKLKSIVQRQTAYREMLLEGSCRSPRVRTRAPSR